MAMEDMYMLPNPMYFPKEYQTENYVNQGLGYDLSESKQVTHLIIHDKDAIETYDILHNENEPVTKARINSYIGERGVALFKEYETARTDNEECWRVLLYEDDLVPVNENVAECAVCEYPEVALGLYPRFYPSSPTSDANKEISSLIASPVVSSSQTQKPSVLALSSFNKSEFFKSPEQKSSNNEEKNPTVLALNNEKPPEVIEKELSSLIERSEFDYYRTKVFYWVERQGVTDLRRLVIPKPVLLLTVSEVLSVIKTEEEKRMSESSNGLRTLVDVDCGLRVFRGLSTSGGSSFAWHLPTCDERVPTIGKGVVVVKIIPFHFPTNNTTIIEYFIGNRLPNILSTTPSSRVRVRCPCDSISFRMIRDSFPGSLKCSVLFVWTPHHGNVVKREKKVVLSDSKPLSTTTPTVTTAATTTTTTTTTSSSSSSSSTSSTSSSTTLVQNSDRLLTDIFGTENKPLGQTLTNNCWVMLTDQNLDQKVNCENNDTVYVAARLT